MAARRGGDHARGAHREGSVRAPEALRAAVPAPDLGSGRAGGGVGEEGLVAAWAERRERERGAAVGREMGVAGVEGV